MNSRLGHACSLCGSEALLCTNTKFAECYVKGISFIILSVISISRSQCTLQRGGGPTLLFPKHLVFENRAMVSLVKGVMTQELLCACWTPEQALSSSACRTDLRVETCAIYDSFQILYVKTAIGWFLYLPFCMARTPY